MNESKIQRPAPPCSLEVTKAAVLLANARAWKAVADSAEATLLVARSTMASCYRLRKEAGALVPDTSYFERLQPLVGATVVGDLMKYSERCKASLMEWTPMILPLNEFLRVAGSTDFARLLYKLIHEAVKQCDDLRRYYLQSKFEPNHVLTMRNMPCSPDYHDSDLEELSELYWDYNTELKSSEYCPIECVAILRHGLRKGASTMGFSLYEFDRQHE